MSFKNKIKNFLLTINVLTASLMLNAERTCAQSLFESGESSSANAIFSFINTYQQWFYLGLFVSVLLYYVIKDEKMKGYLQKLIFGLVIVFILSIDGMQGVVEATLKTVAGWYTGA